jgi:DDE superfamily endonuclease/Helix-turn-helix of DDE superfamily endonuclease
MPAKRGSLLGESNESDSMCTTVESIRPDPDNQLGLDGNESASPPIQNSSTGSSGISLAYENSRFKTNMDHNYSKAQKNAQFFTLYVDRHVGMSNKFLSESLYKFYTGVSKQVFDKICNILGNHYQYEMVKISHENQILLFLMRLRLGLLMEDLAFRFLISRPMASKIFNFWLPRAAGLLNEIICWLPKEVINSTMPTLFQQLYPNTTCIIDGTEVFVQRPFNLRARAQVYSNYKKHTTVKFLVAIAPSGYFMFVSKAFGGRASDKLTINKSGFLSKIQPGMEIMADRGYTITEELGSRGAKLNVPAFTRGRKQLSAPEIIKTRRIASVRIHVERAIARLKSFRILKNTFPLKSVESIEDIIMCCAALSNLQPPLIQRATASRKKVLNSVKK